MVDCLPLRATELKFVVYKVFDYTHVTHILSTSFSTSKVVFEPVACNFIDLTDLN